MAAGGECRAQGISRIPARVCGACGKVFSSQEFLEKHIYRRHRGLEASDPRDPTTCSAGMRLPPAPPTRPRTPPGETRPPVAPVPRGAVHEDPEKDEQPEARSGDPGVGVGVGGDDDRKVEEGARRLGELVREREQARFRSEVDALRKEVEELKVRAGRPVLGR